MSVLTDFDGDVFGDLAHGIVDGAGVPASQTGGHLLDEEVSVSQDAGRGDEGVAVYLPGGDEGDGASGLA